MAFKPAEQKTGGRFVPAEEVPTPSSADLAFEPASAEPPPPFDVAKIPESTVYGALGGYVAPEVLKYGGKALQFSPYGQPAAGTLGRGMEVSGEALRGRRGASAVSGATGGGIGETAYQLTRSMGAPEPVAIGSSLFAVWLHRLRWVRWPLAHPCLEGPSEMLKKVALVRQPNALPKDCVGANLLNPGQPWTRWCVP
jgi:hypothetical protein